MASIFQFFSSLLAKIVAFAEWILLVIKQVFVDIYNLLTDIPCYMFDQVLKMASGALNAIEIPFNPQSYLGAIGGELANMLGLIGITQALTIITSALVIRFLLQTIPFVRWGS
jgi:hypothetical protein